MLNDIEIAEKAKLRKISDVAKDRLGISEDEIEAYGRYKAKVSLSCLDKLKNKKDGKLILVTAISPTPAGEGKTTTTVGLGDALNLIGKKTMICLREPSLGPVFGMKGGATGGGYAQIVPMEDINLHFTGDFAAIAAAHNLLAAMLDNHIYHGNELGIDTKLVFDVTLPVAKNEPVTCVAEFTLTVEPSSSIFELAICSPLCPAEPFVNRFLVI